MSAKEYCEWLQHLAFSTEIRESTWLFPTIETVHVLALVLVVGSIFIVDLRLLGFTNRTRAVREVMAHALPWTWSAFFVAALAGSLLFSSRAVTYYEDIPFRLKMICMLFAGINTGCFHFWGLRRIADWDHGSTPPAAKMSGGFSLLLWITIVGAGRWIGFTT
jgi:hypothetical protein